MNEVNTTAVSVTVLTTTGSQSFSRALHTSGDGVNSGVEAVTCSGVDGMCSARARWVVRVVIAILCVPLLLLIVLSLGSGWAFPSLLPDRIDFAPWHQCFSERDGLIRSFGTSVFLSLVTAILSTSAGFLLARRMRDASNRLMLFLLYLPFVVSPVVAGMCLYDLTIRLQLVGTISGVLFVQCVFATSFAAIYFREAFTYRLHRTEDLIRTLGGGRLVIWQHALWPQCRGLIYVCLIQTALYSWLDYGLVSVIGGGRVVPLTVKLFGYIREASSNQAALASLILLLPAIAGLLITITGRNERRLHSLVNSVNPEPTGEAS